MTPGSKEDTAAAVYAKLLVQHILSTQCHSSAVNVLALH